MTDESRSKGGQSFSDIKVGQDFQNGGFNVIKNDAFNVNYSKSPKGISGSKLVYVQGSSSKNVIKTNQHYNGIGSTVLSPKSKGGFIGNKKIPGPYQSAKSKQGGILGYNLK